MPLTEKQREYLLNCSHCWNVKTGATGSGKSFVDMIATIPKRILASRGEGLIVLMGNTRGTLERNILEPMRSLWPGCVGEIRSDNTAQIFGKKCYCLGADTKKHVSRIQGATFEYVYGDEVTTWSRDVFEMLKSRLRCEHSHFDGTCNPDNPGHWFKQFLDSDADVYQQAYIIDDGVLPAHVVAELKKEYAGTIYYDRFILGLWTAATGIIYPMYQDALGEAPEGEPAEYTLSLDYGTQNAFSAGLWGLFKIRNQKSEIGNEKSEFRNQKSEIGNEKGPREVWWRIREYYYSGRDTGVQKTDEEYAQALDSFTEGIGDHYNKLRVIVDPSAASFIALLRKRGKYKVVPADNAVADGIRETATCLKKGIIRIGTNCKDWIREAQGYVWDESVTEDKPMKVNDHAMDDTRYFVKTKHLAKPERKEKSDWEWV